MIEIAIVVVVAVVLVCVLVFWLGYQRGQATFSQALLPTKTPLVSKPAPSPVPHVTPWKVPLNHWKPQ